MEEAESLNEPCFNHAPYFHVRISEVRPVTLCISPSLCLW